MNKNKMMRYLSCHCECNGHIYNYAKKLKTSDIENARDQRTSKIRSMVSAVRLEIHKMRGYVRLAPLGDSILYGYLRPKHKVGGTVSKIMAHRYPSTIVVLGNSNRSWISLYTPEGLSFMESGSLESVMERLKQLTNINDEKASMQKLWENYYRSQYRPERRNLKYFHNNMTLTSMRSARTVCESNKCGTTLDEFMEK